MIYRSFHKMGLALCALFLACTPKSDPPKFNSPLSESQMEACKDAGLNVQHFSTTQMRRLVSCLNGDTGILQPYKDLVDGLSDDELSILLEIYNRHIVSKDDNRLNKSIDLIDRLRTQGNLQVLFNNLVLLTNAQVPQKLIPVLANAFALETKPDGKTWTPQQEYYRFLVHLIDNDLLSPAIIATSNAFSGPSGKVLAYLMSSKAFKNVMSTDQMIDLSANILLDAMNDRSLHAFWVHLSDAQVTGNLRAISNRQILGLADVLGYFSETSVEGRRRLEQLQRLQIAADKPLICFKRNGGQSYRRADSLLHFIALESSRRQGKDAVDQFFLQSVPVLLTATDELCDYPQEAIKNLDLIYQSVRLGYGEGLHGMMSLLAKGSRFQEITSVTKSPYVPKAAPLLEDLSKRGAPVFLVQLMARDLTEGDVRSLGVLLNYLTAQTTSPEFVFQWINKQAFSVATQAQLVAEFKALPPGQQTFAQLSNQLAGKPHLDGAYREFKMAMAQTYFDNGPEAAFQVMLNRVLNRDETARGQLKGLANAVIDSWRESDGGIGEFLNIWAKATDLSSERPVQMILRDTLNDIDLMNRITPLLLKIAADPKLMKAVDFTGQIAANGDLDRLLKFVVDLFKSSGGPGLEPRGPIYQLSAVRNVDIFGMLEQYRPGQTISPPNFTQDCTDLSGNLFSKSGTNLERAARCFVDNERERAQVLEVIADLKARPSVVSGTALSDFNDLANQGLRSPYLGNSLTQLEILHQKGILDKAFKLVSLSAGGSYRIPYRLDPVLFEMSSSDKFDPALQYLGRIISSKDLKETIRTGIKIFNTPGKRQFFSNNNFRLKVADPDRMRRQIADFLPNETPEFREKVYQEAREKFETHNDAWFYEDGPYIKYNQRQFKDEVLLFLNGMKQGTNLKELIFALRDVGRGFSMPEFLQQAMDSQEVTIHYTKTGDPRIRIVNQMDELETLIRNGDTPVAYVSHIATAFQIAVVNSRYLPVTMEKQLLLVRAGEKYTGARDKITGKVSAQHFMIKNLITNFNVLRDMAASGALKAFQRIYGGLYNATPYIYRDVDDPRLNHMSLLNHLNNIGIFAQLSMVLGSARDQHQLENILNSVFGLLDRLSEEDVENLRKLVEILMLPSGPGEPPRVEYFLDRMMEVNQDPVKLRNLKDTLYHLLPAIQSLQLPMTQVIKSLPALAQYPATWKRVVDFLFDDSVKDEGLILSFAAAVSDRRLVNTKSLEKIRSFLELTVSNDKGAAGVFLPDVVELLASTYAKRQDSVDRLAEAVEALGRDPQVNGMNLSNLIREAFDSLEFQDGLGDSLGEILKDDKNRLQLANIIRTLSAKQDFDKLFHILVRAINSGQLSSSLDFVFDNLKLKSVN